MKVAIISDLHDNESYLDSFLNSQQADVLLICGDIGHEETLSKIAESFSGPIYFVFGNADLFGADDVPGNVTNLDESGIIELDNKKIGLCHEPYKIKELLKEKPYIIFYGHTHTPWIKEEDGVWIVNPGTLGGVRTPSTYAVWDTDKPVPELIRTDAI